MIKTSERVTARATVDDVLLSPVVRKYTHHYSALLIIVAITGEGKGEGEVAVFSAKRWNRRNC